MKKFITLSLACCVLGIFPGQAQYNVSTYAGTGTAGLVNGPTASAQFNYPYGVEMDASGVMYVADAYNHCIRKITAAGVVSTFAGTGSSGLVNGPGSSAQFYQPTGLALDGSGNLIVADDANNCIRKIDPAGNVTTLAGTGSPGFVNGASGVAKFLAPKDICIGPNGDIYVADYENHAIRVINATTGNVTTLTGNGTPGSADGSLASATFYRPRDLVFDSQGNLYVTDLMNNTIRKITPAGVVSTFAGSGTAGTTDGIGTAATFNRPTGITIDQNDNLYVVDGQGHKVRRISTSTAQVVTIAGTGAAGFMDGAGSVAQFDLLQDICLNATGSAIYLGDRNNNRVRVIDNGKSSVNELSGEMLIMHVYPNPASSGFYIEIPSVTGSEKMNISLYDETGRMVYNEQMKVGPRFFIPAEGIANGLYLLRVATGESTATLKIMISK